MTFNRLDSPLEAQMGQDGLRQRLIVIRMSLWTLITAPAHMARENRGKKEFLKLPPWQVNESHFTP